MPWFVPWLAGAGGAAIVGIVTVVCGIREKGWSRYARVWAVILGLSVALAAFSEVFTILYLIGCEPTMSCI